MKMPNVVNVIDLEHDNGRIIEVGLTTVDVKNAKILTKYSMPILWPGYEVSSEIAQLTGWTTAKLVKRGESAGRVCERLFKYGITNRMLVVDQTDDAHMLTQFYESTFGEVISPPVFDLSALFFLSTGLPNNLGLKKMMDHFGLSFEGKLHNGGDDSYNIARLFLAMVHQIRCGEVEFVN